MNWLRKFKRVSYIHFLPDVALIVVSLYLSLFLRVGGTSDFDRFLPTLHLYLPLFISIRVITFIFMDIYLMLWRYVTTYDVFKLLKATVLSSSFVLAIAMLIPNLGILPRSMFFIDALVLTLLLMGARIARRLIYEKKQNHKQDLPKTKTLIIGAGNTGKMLAQRFQAEPNLNINLIGFIDDDSTKLGRVLNGSKVLGTLEDLESLLETHSIKKVIVAISHLKPVLLKEIFSKTRQFNILPQITTHSESQESPSSKVHNIYREVKLGDLLQRPTRQIDLQSIKSMIKNHRVLITGAGGSIGSEISRQILSHEPSQLLLLDHSEFNLFNIDKELRVTTHDLTNIVPLLIDIKDKHSLDNALKKYKPEIIFHAAAYKHVHLVETNPYSSILNNILGTFHLIEIAKELNVSNFVNISTDKAVNPAGIMGATKRVSEILVTLAAIETNKPYCSVRFGNVLGSSGSLIPTLKEQIKTGGPVTITHKDMTRYFMLIPEAVQLVLTAATLSTPGDINVLKMGEPVKILEIAKNLITLMGYSPDDIPIIFTGLRPGEKMFEELYIRGDELNTEHPDILSIPNGDFKKLPNHNSIERYKNEIIKMSTEAQMGQTSALEQLSQIVQSNYKCNKQHVDGKKMISNLITQTK